MDDVELNKTIIEIYLEDNELNDIETREQLINCIPSKYKLQGKMKKKKNNKI